MNIVLKAVLLGAALIAAGAASAQTVRKPDAWRSRPALTPESIMPGTPAPGVGTGAIGAIRTNPAAAISSTLFAPAFAGDGQTSNWRIISASAAGRQPWTAIGNFLIPGIGGYCSAVLVAPRIVLTANHCLYAPDYNRRDARGNAGKQLMDSARFVFVAGVHDSSFVDSIPVEKVITGGWAPGAEDTSRDWAIAILARAASDEIVPIAFKPYDPKAVGPAWRNRLMIAAYPGASFAFSSVLRFSLNCSLLQSGSANVVMHDCQSENGSSGGPILVQEDGELRLIGIHSSSRQYSQARNGVSVNGFLAELNSAVARYR